MQYPISGQCRWTHLFFLLQSLPPATAAELEAMELKLNDKPVNYFRKFNGYFYSSTMCDSPVLGRAKLLFQSEGGQCEDINQNVFHNSSLTHIFALREDLKQCEEIFRGTVSERDRKPIILDCKWILDCTKEECLLSERSYTVNAIQK